MLQGHVPLDIKKYSCFTRQVNVEKYVIYQEDRFQKQGWIIYYFKALREENFFLTCAVRSSASPCPISSTMSSS